MIVMWKDICRKKQFAIVKDKAESEEIRKREAAAGGGGFTLATTDMEGRLSTTRWDDEFGGPWTPIAGLDPVREGTGTMDEVADDMLLAYHEEMIAAHEFWESLKILGEERLGDLARKAREEKEARELEEAKRRLEAGAEGQESLPAEEPEEEPEEVPSIFDFIAPEIEELKNRLRAKIPEISELEDGPDGLCITADCADGHVILRTVKRVERVKVEKKEEGEDAEETEKNARSKLKKNEYRDVVTWTLHARRMI